MQLRSTGTVRHDDYAIRFCPETGEWCVSRSGNLIGYVPTLAEVPGLVARQRERVRARLAAVEAEAARRKAAREAEAREVASATKR